MDRDFEFWVIRRAWPGNTRSHVFLGNAVNEIGKALFGSAWTGAEPATKLMALSNRQRERGCFSEEIAKDRATKRPALERFSRVKATIIRLAETEQLATALRPVDGGDPVPLHRSLWNSERLDVRFHSCQMNPRKPFDNAVAGDGYGLVFVTRESLQNCLALVAGTPSAIPTNAQTSSERDADANIKSQKMSIKARAGKFKEWRESRGDIIPSEQEDIAYMKNFGVGRDAVRELRRNAPKLSRGRPAGRTPK